MYRERFRVHSWPVCSTVRKSRCRIHWSSAAVSTNTGTAGLHLAMHVLGVEHNDLVIMPTMTFVASANAISQCGATPLLIDIDPDTWLLDADMVESFLETQTTSGKRGRIHNQTGRCVSAILVVYTKMVLWCRK